MVKAALDENWKTCFARLGPGLLLFARQWAHSRADAEDIVQEAFVRFWRYDRSPENRALLYAAVRSIAMDFWRRDRRREHRESQATMEQQLEVQFELPDETQRSLADAVSELPQAQREVVVMKIWNELTFAEIAEVLQISPNTAASRYRYALAALRKSLPQHHG